jgi:hypothetical protein
MKPSLEFGKNLCFREKNEGAVGVQITLHQIPIE